MSANTPPWPPQEPLDDATSAELAVMVRDQLAAPSDGRRAIRSPEVLNAFRRVPRHLFVPHRLRADACADRPLPIGNQQTISQPYIVARMLEELAVSPSDRVLDVGTGSGYQAALLYQLSPQVFSVEVVPALLEKARETLGALGYGGISLRLGDANFGWPTQAPYTRIVVACAAKELPEALWDQLAPGGVIIIPLEDPQGTQSLFRVDKLMNGSKRSTRLSRVSFVPFINSSSAEHPGRSEH